MKSKSSGWLWALGALAAAGGGYWYWDKTRKREYLVAYMRISTCLSPSSGSPLEEKGIHGLAYFDTPALAQAAKPPPEICDIAWAADQNAKGCEVEFVALIVHRTQGPVAVLDYEKACGTPNMPDMEPLDRALFAKISDAFGGFVPNMAKGGPAWYSDLGKHA